MVEIRRGYASEDSSNAPNSLATHTPTSDATSPSNVEATSTNKRPHENDGDIDIESLAKRNHIDSDDDASEDIDLETLIAQLEEHTDKREQPDIGEQNVEQSEINEQEIGLHAETARELDAALDTIEQSHPKSSSDERPEGELSIEQQLKGALSSLQDFDDDVGMADIGLNQLSQLLKAPTQAAVDKEKLAESPGKEKEKRDEEKESSRHESLMSKMPPPPAHLHGKLPPMPPPPAAFTSPTAPYVSTEIQRPTTESQQSNRIPHSTAVAAQIPVLSEAPAQYSATYEKALADQVDNAGREDKRDDEDKEDDEKRTEKSDEKSVAPRGAKPAMPLNDNKAVMLTRRRSMLLIDSLACQILEILSSNHYQETLSTVMQPDSERGMTYRILLDAFEDLKRVYFKWETSSSRKGPQPKPMGSRPFLPYNLNGVEQTRDNMITIQRVNLATFVAAIFGTIEIGFWELDEWFIRVFVPENGRLLKQQANIYLDLKTQAFISAVESSNSGDEKENKEVYEAALEHLFPTDLENKIQDRFGERVSLAPTEKDFVAKCHRRRENIKSESKADLPTKYHWVPFLREVSDYVSRNHYTLLPPRKLSMLPAEIDVTQNVLPASSSSVAPCAPSAPASRPYSHSCRQAPAPSSRPPRAVEDDAKKTDVEVTSVTRKVTPQDGPKLEITETADSETADGDKKEEEEEQNERDDNKKDKRSPDIPSEGHPMFPPLPKQVLPPPSGGLATSQPEPERIKRPGPRAHMEVAQGKKPVDTLAAYEAARASAEGTVAMRPKTSMFTTRRTWTKEEEEALLKGMDRVQGPYWAQILELYGPGGKISEILKDRNQVQLKDKARNLKMFFVRLGLPIPAVFQYVTGDYETRRGSAKRLRAKMQQQQMSPKPSSLSQMQNTQSVNKQISTVWQPTQTSTTQQMTAQHGAGPSNNSAKTTVEKPVSEVPKLPAAEVKLEKSSKGALKNGEHDNSDVDASQGKSDEKATEETAKADEKGRPDDDKEFANRFEADKDDDIDLILNKVGEYVDNH